MPFLPLMSAGISTIASPHCVSSLPPHFLPHFVSGTTATCLLLFSLLLHALDRAAVGTAISTKASIIWKGHTSLSLSLSTEAAKQLCCNVPCTLQWLCKMQDGETASYLSGKKNWTASAIESTPQSLHAGSSSHSSPCACARA